MRTGNLYVLCSLHSFPVPRGMPFSSDSLCSTVEAHTIRVRGGQKEGLDYLHWLFWKTKIKCLLFCTNFLKRFCMGFFFQLISVFMRHVIVEKCVFTVILKAVAFIHLFIESTNIYWVFTICQELDAKVSNEIFTN